jgi:hypothetical protein
MVHNQDDKIERTSALNSEKPYPLPLSLLPKEMSAELDKKPRKSKILEKPVKRKTSKGSQRRQNQARKGTKEPAGKCIMISYTLMHLKGKLNGWFGTKRWTHNKVIYAQQKKEMNQLDLTDYGIVKDLPTKICQ